MDDNFYKVDAVSIRENQENRVAVVIAQMEQKPITTALAFVKSIPETLKIKDRKTEVDIQPLIWIMLVKIAALAGIKDAIDDFNKSDILKMIFTSFSDLTIEEIYKGFELERHSQYEVKTEHFQLFNSEYVSQVLNKYKKWKLNIKVQHNLHSTNLTPEKTLEEKDIENILKNGVNRVYKEYKDDSVLEDTIEHIFDFLIEKDFIKLASENTPLIKKYYDEKTEIAKKQILTESKSFTSMSKHGRGEIKLEISKIKEGKSYKIYVRVKKLVLIDFFDKQIKKGFESIF